MLSCQPAWDGLGQHPDNDGFEVCGLHCREHAPSIIFMDEVDSIGSARTDNGGGGGDSEVQRTMLELLNQLDGFEATNKIKVSPQKIRSMQAWTPAYVMPLLSTSL